MPNGPYARRMSMQTASTAPLPQRRVVPVTFHAEQARRRRSIWRATCVCAVAAVIAGIFLSLVLLLFAPVSLGVVLGLGVRAIQALGLNAAAIATAEMVLTGPNRNAVIVGAASIVILPMLLPPPIAWGWLRSLMLRRRGSPWPAALAVRAPRPGDAEEHQFGNLVAEMAIAAGLPVPAVGIIDAPAPNIGMFGTGHDDAGIAVTRGLLDTLDRGETQMLAAQAIGSIGNGDLRVSASLLAVYRSIGLFMALIDLPVRRTARAAVAALLTAGDREAAYAELDAQLVRGGLARLLLWLPAMLIVPGITLSLVVDRLNVDPDTPLGGLVPALLMLAGAAVLFYGLVRLTLGIWTIFVLGWPLAYLWRGRRFLADATAVRLAGNPQALADALAHLRATCAVPPGGARFAHLFLCRPEGAASPSPLLALEPSFAKRVERLRALGAIEGLPPESAAAAPARPAEAVKLGLGGILLVFFIANFRLTVFLIAAGLGGLLLLSCGAGILLFLTIVNA